MFSLRFKRRYREYEYSRFSKEDHATCIVYERQYNPVMDISGFGFIGYILYMTLTCIFKFEYNFSIALVFFIVFMFIRLLMIIEKDKRSDKGE